ncbi:MAG: metal-dependent hydrolase [Myxococcaceae bacterium]
MRFDLSDVPRHWHGGRKSVTLFYDNLSVFFPLGERFFVASVRAHRPLIRTPALAAAADAFTRQEGHHSREHVHYNELLTRLGYPIERMEKWVTRMIRLVNFVYSPRRRLAATAALEHFTALMATLVLGDDRTMEGAHPKLAALWRWHAAEENEHKSVAFDVFQEAGGTYFERIRAMASATVIFWSFVYAQQVRMMWTDGILFSPREWFALIRFLYVEPGGMLGLFPAYFRYYRRDFHPDENDTRALFDRWKVQRDDDSAYRQAARP